jgi:hypothetical protein
MDGFINFGMVQVRPAERQNTSALALLQAVYRDPDVPLNVRIKCAVEALPYETPKLQQQLFFQMKISPNVSNAPSADQEPSSSRHGLPQGQRIRPKGRTQVSSWTLGVERRHPINKEKKVVPWHSRLSSSRLPYLICGRSPSLIFD